MRLLNRLSVTFASDLNIPRTIQIKIYFSKQAFARISFTEKSGVLHFLVNSSSFSAPNFGKVEGSYCNVVVDSNLQVHIVFSKSL